MSRDDDDLLWALATGRCGQAQARALAALLQDCGQALSQALTEAVARNVCTAQHRRMAVLHDRIGRLLQSWGLHGG